jgi:3-phosphoglycerate kinase
VISKKRLDHFAGEYLEREIDILKKVMHENVVGFVDVL